MSSVDSEDEWDRHVGVSAGAYVPRKWFREQSRTTLFAPPTRIVQKFVSTSDILQMHETYSTIFPVVVTPKCGSDDGEIPWLYFSIKKIKIFARHSLDPGGGFPAGTTRGQWDGPNLDQAVNYNLCRFGAFVSKGIPTTTAVWEDVFPLVYVGHNRSIFNSTGYQFEKDYLQLFDHTFRLPSYIRTSFNETANTTYSGVVPTNAGVNPAPFANSIGGPLPAPEFHTWTPFFGALVNTNIASATSTTVANKNEAFFDQVPDLPGIFERTFHFDAADSWSFNPVTLVPTGGYVACFAKMQFNVGPEFIPASGIRIGGTINWRIEVEYEERKF